MGMHYRKLIVWRKAMDLAKEVYRLAPLLPKEELYGLRSQLTRAAASIPANIAEGWARGTEKQRAQFLAIAHGSLVETETFIVLCEELGWFPEEELVNARTLITEVGKIISRMRSKLHAA